MRKMVNIARITLNIFAHIPRKDIDPFHLLCPSENLIFISKYLFYEMFKYKISN